MVIMFPLGEGVSRGGWGGVGCNNVHVTCVEVDAKLMLRCYYVAATLLLRCCYVVATVILR